MAAGTPVTVNARPLAVAAMVAAGAMTPVAQEPSPAPRSPVAAAQLVEDSSGSASLTWGKLRAWRRTGEGWLLLWQPSHGAWLLRALVEDEAKSVTWRIQAAPWLPGVRLSESLARWVVDSRGNGSAQRFERPARRDWDFAGRRVAGAVELGRNLPEPAARRLGGWPALLAGAVLAGALCLVVLPGDVTHRWTLALTGALVALVAVVPIIVALGYGAFKVGVRPWVAQLALFAALAVTCAALAAFAMRFGALRGRPRAVELAVAAGAGLLAGRAAPAEPLVSVAGLTFRVVVWVAVVLALGYLAAVAAIGLRELLHPLRRLRPLVLASLVVAAVATAGAWLGPVVAVLVAAAVPRSRATWSATTVAGFWVVGCTMASCAWVEPLRDALLVLLAGTGALASLAVAEG